MSACFSSLHIVRRFGTCPRGSHEHHRSSRLNLFKQRLAHVWRTEFPDEDSVHLNTLLPKINQDIPDAMFGSAEGRAACEAMNDAEEIMFSDDMVWKV